VACKLCAWLCGRFCADSTKSFWRQSEDWERANSNDYTLWLEAPVEYRERAETALAAFDADPEASFRVFLELADADMAWAMEMVGSYYAHGSVAAADFELAQDYYCRAIEAGSWMATIGYARLLAGHGDFGGCEAVLLDGVEQDFIPAWFWLARYRLKQSSRAAVCREVRPLLEHAADAGHPAAALYLARLKLLGKFGFREIPAGFRQILKVVERSSSEASAPNNTPAEATG